MKKQGFTLVEILAVITLLGIMALLIIPAIEGIIRGTEEDAYNTQIESMKLSLKNWGAENVFKLPSNDGEFVEVTLGDLKLAGYVPVEFKDPRDDKCFSNSIVLRITREKSNYDYSIQGNITTSDICEVE